MIYTNYEDLERDFKSGIVTPQMLKQAVSKCMNELLEISLGVIEKNPDEWNIIVEARKKKMKKNKKI